MEKITRIFFTSDWHLGHKNILDYDKRPFRDLEHMHKVLINNFNASVRPTDLCYFLGDMGLSRGTVIKDVMAQLNGTKVLIKGNHDKGTNAMFNMGFDVVMYGASLQIAGELVTLTHCPLERIWREDVTNMKGSQPGECWHGEFKNRKYSIPPHSGFHLHGHIHSPPEKKIQGRQYDVGVRANNYRPVYQGQIESWIALHKSEVI